MRTEIEIDVETLADEIRSVLNLAEDDDLIDAVCAEVIDNIDTADIVTDVVDSTEFERALAAAVEEALADSLAESRFTNHNERIAALEARVAKLAEGMELATKLLRVLLAD